MSRADALPAIQASAFNWTPTKATTGTLVGWYEVKASLVTQSAGLVSNLANLVSGGANPLVQATSTAQPTFEAAGWGAGGRDSLVFDGTGDFLSANGLGAGRAGSDQPFTVLWLGQILTLGSSASQRNIWGFGNTADDMPQHDLRLPDSTINTLAAVRRDSASVSKVKNAATAPTTSRVLYADVFTGTRGKHWTNGVLDANLDAGVTSSSDLDVGTLTGLNTFTLGAIMRTGISGFVNMRFAAMLVYSGALSDLEVREASHYLTMGHPL